MKVDEKLIKKVAQVARLELTDKEVKKFTPQLKEVLDFFSELDKIKVDEEPSFQAIDLKNVMREDEIKECLSQEEALANTTHKKDGYFKGPKSM